MKTFFQKIYRNKRGKILSIVVLLLFVAGGTAFAYAEAVGEVIEWVGESVSSVFTDDKTGIQQSDTEYLEEQKQKVEQETEAAIHAVAIDTPVINKLDGTHKKLKQNYKKILVEKEVPATQKSKLETFILNYDDPKAVLTLFDYLHDNFFTFYDLEDALARYSSGEPIENILQSYIDIQDQIEPRDYPHAEIERLVTTPGLTTEDIMIAEILDAHGSAAFYDVINARIAGDNWETIAERYNLINGSAQIQSVIVGEDEVEACRKATGLSREEAYKKVIDAKKAEIEPEKIVEFAMSGKRMGVAMKEKAEKKLQQW